MTDDIGPILERWKYKPNDINVRLVKGVDGREKLQMRIDLGLLQMDLDGRPDGKRPYRYDSYLTYYENRLKKSEEKHKSFELNPVDCLHLQQESIQYYHRYLALIKLGDYIRVARDTRKNLRIFDFVSKYCSDDQIHWSFEQYRPYVIMMHTRALASISLDNENYDEAISVIENGLEQIQEFYATHQDRAGNQKFELDFLTKWKREIRDKRPLSEREKLEKELTQAIKSEEYERAAEIRDLLRYLEISKRKTE
jgi:tetratricopeptide (TPR) repeat protein